ncbi:hypothetical protein CR205_11595 [Alteribacter lacisalsi]|uniref:Uncharacterized protein n=1 Tax=Alteribacter lacisalsi TaxID=2045244 RepID=A0A2W0H3G5_9BACI|nr:hypothetical protein CR205_11595 [Alteribacter lacisalsi]
MLTDDNVVVNQVNDEEATINLTFESLDQVGVDAGAVPTIAELTFTLRRASEGIALMEMDRGEFTYVDGDVLTTRLLPYDAVINGGLLCFLFSGIYYLCFKVFSLFNNV